MPHPLRLMAVLAHPDDESLGCGGTLAKYAAEGVETYLVTATLGERGWQGDPADDPGLAALACVREAELRCAVAILGIRELALLGYIDGDQPGHRVDKLYYLATDQPLADVYLAIFGDISMAVDGVTRLPYWLPDWQVSALIDATNYWQQTWAACRCHASQLPPSDVLDSIPDETHRFLWGYQPFVRAFSFVNRGHTRETDLFEGLR